MNKFFKHTVKQSVLSALCVLLILLLAACVRQSHSSSVMPATSVEAFSQAVPTPPANDAIYTISGYQNYTWLENGEVLAVPHGNLIQYIDLNNQLIKTVEIAKDSLVGGYTFLLSDNRIFVMNGRNGQDGPNNFIICKRNGAWVLANGTVWDSDGNLMREFLHFRVENSEGGEERLYLSDGREVASWQDTTLIETAAWISDDLVALNGHSRLFFYRISTDTLTLVDDMSEWMAQFGKSQAYYGVDAVFPAADGKGCYYFAYKNAQKSNTAGSIWYADETGTRALFDGQEFSRMVCENGTLAMIEWVHVADAGDTQTTRLFYAREDDLALREIAAWEGDYNIERAANGYIMLKQGREPYRFYAMDTSDATLSSFVPQIENCYQYAFLGVRRQDSGLQYIYGTFINGARDYYLYDDASGQNRQLEGEPFLFNDEALHQPATHFVERHPNESYDDMFHTIGVRVKRLE